MPERKVTFIVGSNIRNFQKGMRKAQATFKRVGQNMQRIGGQLSQNVTLPIIGLGAAMGKTAIDFESAFAGVRKTVDATEDQFATLRQGILDMSKELPTSAGEIAAVAEAAGQLGIKAENILEFTRTMVMLGDTTDIVADQAAKSLARIANVLQLPQDQFDEMGSTIVDLGNNFATTESEIVDMSTRIAAAGKIADLTASDVFAIATALSSVGVNAESGGTAAQKGILAINDAVARGGNTLSVFAQTAGMTSEAFTEAWRKDAGQAFSEFIKGLGRQGAGATLTLEKVGLQSERTRAAFLSLSNSGDLLNNTLETGRNAWEENNALTKEAEQRYNTMASDISEAFNSLKAIAASFEGIIKPAIKGFTDAVKEISSVLENLSDETKKRVLILAGLFAAGGPIITALGVLSTAFAAISGPVLAAVAGIGLAAVAIIKHWDKVKVYFTRGPGKDLWISLRDLVSETVKLIKATWDKFGDEIIAITAFFMNRIVKTTTYTLDQIKNVVKLWRHAVEGDFRGALSTVSDMFEDWSYNMADLAKDAGKMIWGALTLFNPLKITFNFVTGMFDVFFGDLEDKAKKAGENIGKSFNQGLRNALSKSPWQFGQQPFNFTTAGTGTGGGSGTSTNFKPGISATPFKNSVATPSNIQNWDQFKVKVDETFDAWGSLKDRIAQTNMNNFNTTMSHAMDIANQFTSSFGQGLTNIIVQGNKVVDVLKNIGKLFLSSAIQKGISILLTGGLGGSGFFGDSGGIFGNLFGDIFGKAFGVDDAIISPTGQVITTHPDNYLIATKSPGDMAQNVANGRAAMSASQVVVDAVINLDGRQIYKGLLKTEQRINR